MRIYMAQPMKLFKWSWHNPCDFSKCSFQYLHNVFGKTWDKTSFMQMAQTPPAKYACSISLAIYIHHSVTCQYIVCTKPLLLGAAYSNVQVIPMRSVWLGSRACIPTCLPVAHEDEEGSLMIYFRCVYFGTLLFELVHETMPFVGLFYFISTGSTM